ncbi:MAG: hypothetical protein CMD77_07115 [Gammaproteobacteria bacterium]|nr:hypothetical protein [Gammaproteobacteria bacterium]
MSLWRQRQAARSLSDTAMQAKSAQCLNERSPIMSNNAQSTRIHASRTATGWKTKSRSSPAEGRARAFAREAAKVILMVRQEDKGRAVETAIRNDGGEATFISCDVADKAAVAAAVNQAAAAHATINVLFNNTGGGGALHHQ